MHKTALFTTLSLLSVLNSAWAARVVVTQVHTVVVDGNAPAQTPPPVVNANKPVIAEEVNNAVVVPAPTTAKTSALSSTSSSKSAAVPSATGGTGGGTGGGYGGYGTASVRNNCDYDIQMAPVYGKDVSRGTVTIAKGKSWSDKIQPFTGGFGAVFKVTTNGAKVVQFEYTTDLGNSELWYDISYVDCAGHTKDASQCSQWSKGHAIRLPSKCRQVLCKPGTFCPTEAYYIETYRNNTLGIKQKDSSGQMVDVPDPNYGCGAGSMAYDIEYVVCSGNSQSALKKKRSVAGRIEVEEEY